MGEEEARATRSRRCSARTATSSSSARRSSATARRIETPLGDAIGDWLAEADPGAELAPIVMPGFSDSHWFRKAFDSAVVYGFCPHREISLLEAAR